MNANEPTLPEESLFLQALELDSPVERTAFLDRACGADAVLRNDVEALLRHHREGTSFLETPPTEVVAAAEQITTIEAEGPALDFLSPSNEALSLGRLGYYEIIEVLGHGGFGVVLKARDTKLDRIVAVKTLAQSLATSATARKRFVREAKAAAAVKHENVVGIYHVSDEGPVPFLVMECVSGVSLEAKLQEVGTLDLPAILRIGMQIASGLAAAHKQGLVHRDVKPGNILLENGVERVKITDFGLARAADDAAITKTGEVAGTPQYMSPEQAQGLSLDARSDLFSLGSVLYAMATGRSPFRAESTIAALRRVCDDTPRPIRETNADIPEWLAGIINRLLAKQPSERYQTATEVADLLGLHLAAVQQSAIVPSPKPTIVSPRHRSAIGARWWSVALIALVAIACIMGLTEASGVTKVVPTVIRIVRGEGTLVIEVDDPTVQVSLDGEALSIRGAGLQELRLLPGKYRLHATKDGQPVKDEVVTISRDGRKVVTVTLESPVGSGSTGVTPSVEQRVGEFTLLAKLDGHSDLVRAVAFLPDGRRMVSVGRDKMVRIWDVKTRSVLSMHPVDGFLRDANVSADGRFIAMAFASEKNGIIHVWDVEKRERICELVQVGNRIDCIRLSPDGTQVVTGGDPSGGVLWDLSTRKEVRRFSVDDPSATLALEFSPDGSRLAIGAVGRVRLFDVKSGDVVGDAQLPQPRAVLGLAFSPSGKSLACGQMGGRTSLIDVELCRVTMSLPDSDPDAHVLRLRFLNNERFLLTTRYDTTLQVWDIERMKVVATAATEKGTNQRLDVSPDGQYAVIAGGEDWNPKSRSYRTNGDYVLRLWQLPQSVWPKERTPASSTKESPALSSVVPAAQPTPDELTLLTKLQGHTNIVHAVSFLPDGERMVSVDQNSFVRTWDLETRSVLSTLDLKGYRCGVAEVSADGRFVAISASAERTRMIRVWDLQNRKQICEAVHQQDVDWLNCIRFTPDGTHVLTSGKPHVGVLWNIATGKEVQRFEVQDLHSTGAAQFSPDGRLLAMEGSGRVRLFDVESGELQGDAHLPEPDNVISLAFSPSGDLLACGHMGGRTDVFEVNSRQLTAQLTNDKSSSHVISMRFIDNERLLITRFGGAFEVWDLPRTKIVATAASERGTTKRLALSPNGRYALAAHGEGWDEQSKSPKPTGDYALRLWQLPESVWPKEPEPTPEDLKLVKKLDGHSDVVRAVAFSPDSQRIVSVGRVQKVQVWDLETRNLLSTLPVEGHLSDADVSLDGRFVAVVSNVSEKKVAAQVWDLEKRERMCTLTQEAKYAHCIRFSPDAARVVTCNNPSCGVLWDVATGTVLHRLDIGDTSITAAAALSLNGELVALGAVGRVRLFDAGTGQVLTDIHLPENRHVNDLVFNSTGETLACGQASGSVHLIDVDTREVTKSIKVSDAPVVRMRLLGNEQFLLATCFDATLRLVDIERGQVVATAATEKGTNERLAISPDGRYAVTASGEYYDRESNSHNRNGDYALRLWQLPESVWPKEPEPTPEDLKLVAKLEGHSNLVLAAAFLPDGRRMVSVSHDRLARIWDLPTRAVLSTLPLEGGQNTADMSADGRLVAFVSRREGKGVVRVWNIEKREVVCHFAQEFNEHNCIRFSPDGTRLVTSGLTSGVPQPYGVLWDAATGEELGRFDMGDTNGVHEAAFSPDGRLLALGAVGRVRLFDIESGEGVADVPLPNPWNVWDLEFAPSGKTLATGQGGGHVSIIDVDSRRVIKTLQGSAANRCSLRFLGNDNFLLTSSVGATLRVWDLKQEKVLAHALTGNGTNRGLFVSPDGRQVITAGGKEWDDASSSMKDYGDYALRLWQLPESVWPPESPAPSSSAETAEQAATPKDP